MKFSCPSLVKLGTSIVLLLNLYAISVESASQVPSYILTWSLTLKEHFSKNGLKFHSSDSLESLLLSEVVLENFDVSCTALLQRTVQEFSNTANSWTTLNLDLALDICSYINPWNSMECNGISGVYASLARSIQEYVHTKDQSKGDLRAACILTSAIAPSRPFSPLKKGSIKAKCEEVCSGALSSTISAIDSSFCSPSMDLCRAVDHTMYSSFKSLSDRDFGIASAISILLSEGQFGLRTTFREGCRFVSHLKSTGKLPMDSCAVSDSIISSELITYYNSKLQEAGLLQSGRDSDSQMSATLKLLLEQVVRSIKTVLDCPVEAPKKTHKTKKSSHVVSTFITSSDVSPLSSVSQESPESDVISSRYSGSDKSLKLLPVQEAWLKTLSHSINKLSDEDRDSTQSLISVVKSIDNSRVYSSCVRELKKSHLVSHRKISDICRKIDPFSDSRCQKLNHFDLVFLIKLKEELENTKDLLIDLRDLCNVASKMSLKAFLKNKDEELSDKCIASLQKQNIREKYHLSSRAIRKACVRADYIRHSSCGDIFVGTESDRLDMVLALSQNIFDRKSDKERLQLIRSEEASLSYADLCSAVERIHTDSVEDCILELRSAMFRHKEFSSIFDLEGACVAAYSGEFLYDRQFERGQATRHYYDGYRPSFRRRYTDIEYAPEISLFPWSRHGVPCDSVLKSTSDLKQEFSASRRGYYKDSKGNVQFHDGIRYHFGGLWYLKIGDEWYIDSSSSSDFVRITPDDPRYKRRPFSHCYRDLYGRETARPYATRSFAAYSAPRYEPRSYSYLFGIYGKPGTSPTPHGYKRCKECDSWNQYPHLHTSEGRNPDSFITTVEHAGFTDEGEEKVERNEYDADGRWLSSTTERSKDNAPRLGTREVGVNTTS